MSQDPLFKLKSHGQSVWLDFLRRKLVTGGDLQALIDKGVTGVTSNPAIFKKAIADSTDYDSAVQTMLQNDFEVDSIYQTLVTEDVRQAADLLRPIYENSDGVDGFVSLEVSPHLAYDTDKTIAEARQLWSTVDRPNLFIKVPATLPGLPAIETLISEGINVNVTLLFSRARYREVTQAYLDGIRTRAKEGLPVERVTSVASFFVSRVDVLVDRQLEEIAQRENAKAQVANTLKGQVAVANAKLAYQIYQEVFEDGESFRALAQWNARPQRLLWGSTSTKNPDYSDVKYVDELIGPHTINTMPLKTIEAYRDHGDPAPRLTENVEAARQVMVRLQEVGISMKEVTQQLEEEGVQKFADPFDELMDTLARARDQYRTAAQTVTS